MGKESNVNKKYPIGYALGGGGAKGFAHLGAFKVLESYGVKPDIIAGTSAGALAGVLYADGYAPDEIADFFRGHKFMDFAKLSPFSGGLLKPSGVAQLLKKHLRAKRFDQLGIPFVAVATNWENAEVAQFRDGDDLISSVVASCAVPIVFQPVEINHTLYVDGGVLKNLPVSVIKEEAECVLGVNLYEINRFEATNSVKASAMRYFEIVAKYNVKEDMEMADVLINMEGLKNYKMFDLNSIDEIMQLGFDTTMSILPNQETCDELLRRGVR